MKKQRIWFLIVILVLGSVHVRTDIRAALEYHTSKVQVLPQSETSNLTVVTTLSIINDWVAEIGKGVFMPTSIVTGTEDPHTYSLKAGEIQLIGDSDLFIRFGLPGIEPWVDDVLDTFPSLNVLTLASEDMMRVDPVTGNTNPHIWMDPNIVKGFIANITEELVTIDPQHQATYEANKVAYLQKLDILLEKITGEYRSQLEGLKVVVHHPAFMYLFDLLGIERKGVIEEHEGSEPSAQHIQDIINIMKEQNISILVTQPQISDDTIIQIARDTGAKLAKLTPLLGVEDVNTYIDMIEYNIYALQHPESVEKGSGITISVIIGVSILAVAAAVILFYRFKK
ncbi:MAG: metal ABC transporter substrate-binding protein [Candidatus Heimdallarchaeaceae archaeon]